MMNYVMQCIHSVIIIIIIAFIEIKLTDGTRYNDTHRKQAATHDSTV